MKIDSSDEQYYVPAIIFKFTFLFLSYINSLEGLTLYSGYLLATIYGYHILIMKATIHKKN